MTVEVAERLVKLRKKNGLSQEELADKLGVSRQAVSKWERSESSPDTDNLICLAKLYNVSLDELLSTDQDIEDIVKEKKKEDSLFISGNDKESVTINKSGISVNDGEGKNIEINSSGIHICENGNQINIEKVTNGWIKVSNILEGILFLLAAAGYIILGSVFNMWMNGWVIFFVPEIICSILRAIGKRRFHEVNIPFATTFAYFFICMIYPGLSMNLWHPWWVMFFIIPVYYTAVAPIDNFIKKNELKKNGIIDVDEETLGDME